jgi:hypothetical protein
MKFLSLFLTQTKAEPAKTKFKKLRTIEDYRQDLLIQQGKEQFSKLLERGLRFPIAVL